MTKKIIIAYSALAAVAILMATFLPRLLVKRIVYTAEAKMVEVPLASFMRADQIPILSDPELQRICSCESTGRPDQTPRHYDSKGNVLAGVVEPKDRGMCQINQHYWLAQADDLGYDIETPQGNINMANWIYKKYGNKPWVWSKSCWNK